MRPPALPWRPPWQPPRLARRRPLKRLWPLLGLLSLLALLGLQAGCVQSPSVPSKPAPTAAETAARLQAEAEALARAAQEVRVAEAVQRADEAYAYGYPLVLGEMFRQQMSGGGKPEGVRVPANSFWHARQTAPGGDAHPLVGDADTLASFAWLDLGREAMLVTQPAMGRRWYGLALHSQWMQPLDQSGSGVGDGRAARLLVTGPEWTGTVPAGARHVRSPTRHVLLSLRIQATGGAAEVRAARALQAQWRIVPQTARARVARASAGAVEPPAVAVPGASPRGRAAALDTAAYFDLMAQLMGSSAPPAAADAPLLERMGTLGIAPGVRFDMAALEPAVQAALADTGARVRQRLGAEVLTAAQGGWQVLLPQPEFGTDYTRRAAVALADWPGPPPERQLLRMRTRADAAGQALNGMRDYRVVFDKDRQPPAAAFWSLTLQPLQPLQDGQPGGLAAGPERVALGSRDRLPAEADGSLPLFVQNLSPGVDQAALWLPAPKGEFMLTLRLYLPRAAPPPSALPPGSGSWVPPPVTRLP